MKSLDNCILVIFGASGNLTQRKLVPALFDLYRQDILPQRFAVLGVSRTSFSDEAFRERMVERAKRYSENVPIETEQLRAFSEKLYYQSVDTNMAWNMKRSDQSTDGS